MMRASEVGLTYLVLVELSPALGLGESVATRKFPNISSAGSWAIKRLAQKDGGSCAKIFLVSERTGHADLIRTLTKPLEAN